MDVTTRDDTADFTANAALDETTPRYLRIARAFDSETETLYPIWQGMQSLANMFSGMGELKSLDDARYPHSKWTTVRDVMAQN